ncbi:MAG: hypothetical protein MHMPM18_000141 [Marteilia pararefringens]
MTSSSSSSSSSSSLVNTVCAASLNAAMPDKSQAKSDQPNSSLSASSGAEKTQETSKKPQIAIGAGESRGRASKMDPGALGYNGDQKSAISHSQKVICGAIAGAFSRLVTNPFDLVKIRFQVQAEPISELGAKSLNSKYTSLTQAFRSIYKEEGFRGYYKGHLNGQILSISCSITQYACFELVSKVSYQMGIINSHANSFFSGYVSAFAAIFACYPFDILRTRFSSQPNFYYTSNLAAVKSIYKSGGIRGFYSGVVPAVLSQAPQASIFFGMFSVLKQSYDRSYSIFLNRNSKLDEADILRTTVCSFAAGILSKIALYPCDLVKKRMQVQSFGAGRASLGKTYQYKGTFDCVKTIVKYEGCRGLYKGLFPGLVKASVVSSSSLVAYEIVKNLMIEINHKQGVQ